MFSHTQTTGSFQTALMLNDSWKAPAPVAPSPKKQAATSSVPASWAARAAPAAIGKPAPTMPLAPSMPTSKSAMCMLPPLPLQ